MLAACVPGTPKGPRSSAPPAPTESGETPESASGSSQPTATRSPDSSTTEPAAGEASTSPATDAEQESDEEKQQRKRRNILLKTVYDDRAVGEDQTVLVEAELGIYENEDLERYVRSVALRLLRHAPSRPFDWKFKIVDQRVPNAFALPGGKIYVSRGLLALVNSEDELAAVIGHEITHSAERHAAGRIEHARRISPLTIGYRRAATIAAYGREHERDADRGGQILAAKAGYDPNGIATFLRKLDASERYEVGWSRLPSFLSTHPTSPERSALASQRAAGLSWERVRGVAAGQPYGYRGKIDGLVLGDDPAGGLFKDGRFVHPDLRFSLRFPPGWTTANSPQAVSAMAPARDAEASLTVVGEAGQLEKAVDDFFEENADGMAMKVLERRPVQIRGISGIRIVGKARGLHVEMAFFEHAGLTFRLTLLSVKGAAGKYRGRTNAFMQSFRPLDSHGIYSLEVTRLRIARALQNETLEQLSKRTHNDLELVYTGVLNDLFASTQLAKGQAIKIGLGEPYFPKSKREDETKETTEGDPNPNPLPAPGAAVR